MKQAWPHQAIITVTSPYHCLDEHGSVASRTRDLRRSRRIQLGRMTIGHGRAYAFLLSAGSMLPTAAWSDPPPPPPALPQVLGFAHYLKCPSDADTDRLGDTVTPKACMAACRARGQAAGCWWLDGTGGFPRECRVCKTMPPTRMTWPNDWAVPFNELTS